MAENTNLRRCYCGGRVELTGGVPWEQMYGIRCLKCGGRWSMNTYSPVEAMQRWGIEKHQTQQIDQELDLCDAPGKQIGTYCLSPNTATLHLKNAYVNEELLKKLEEIYQSNSQQEDK